MSKNKSIFKIVVEIIILIIIVFIGVVTNGVKESKKNPDHKGLFNINVLNMESSSMNPTLKTDDLVFIKLSNNIGDYKAGKIALFMTEFYGQNYSVIHRIKSINQDGTITFRGDANLVDDNPVEFKDVKGYLIFSIGGLGALTNALSNNMFVYWIIVLVYILLVVYLNIDLLQSKKKTLIKPKVVIQEHKVENKTEEIKQEIKPQVIEEYNEQQNNVVEVKEEVEVIETTNKEENIEIEETIITNEEIETETVTDSNSNEDVIVPHYADENTNNVNEHDKQDKSKNLNELDLKKVGEFIFNRPIFTGGSIKPKLRRRREDDNKPKS